MTDPTLDYFEQYRNKLRTLEESKSNIARLRGEIDRAIDACKKINSEISSMRRIITLMVDTGMDPVEAKLRHDPSDLLESMWEPIDVLDDSITITTYPSSSTKWSSGTATMSSATGAVGSTGTAHTISPINASTIYAGSTNSSINISIKDVI